MYMASIKTKERLAKRRLAGRGISFTVCFDLPFFFEEVSIELPFDGGISIKLAGEMPIMPFEDHMSVTGVLGGQISRVMAIEEAKRLEQETLAQNNILQYRALEARGEFDEFLEHVRNPRFQVPGDV